MDLLNHTLGAVNELELRDVLDDDVLVDADVSFDILAPDKLLKQPVVVLD